MQFAYMGFTQEANIRHYHFQRVLLRARAARVSNVVRFTLNADLALFAHYHIPVQEGPTICLQILSDALAESEDGTVAAATYAVTPEHLSNIAMARTKAEEARHAKRRPRPPFKPSANSQLKWPRTS
jgi:hypothetical protein